MTTDIHELLFGADPVPAPKPRDPRRSEAPNPDIKRVPIAPMSDRGRPDADGLFTQNRDRIDECRDLETHIWVRSIITNLRTAWPLTGNTTAKYYLCEESVFWCSHCGHSLRDRHREEKKITVADYFRLLAPNGPSYPGIDTTRIEGWIDSTDAPDAPIPHHDWEQQAFLSTRGKH